MIHGEQMLLGASSPSFSRSVKTRPGRVLKAPQGSSISKLGTITIDEDPFAHAGERFCDSIGADLGVSRERVRQIGNDGLRQAQVTLLATWLNAALPAASTDALSDLVVFAITSRLGARLAMGDIDVSDLIEAHERHKLESVQVEYAECA